MSAITATTIATVVAAGASAGAGIYAANKQSGAARDAAASQASAAEKTAKIQADAAAKAAQLQTDSANYAANLQSQSARDALSFSRNQSQVSLDQYNQQQQRLNPYRNLGNFALGQPMEGPSAPLQLAALPGQSGQPQPQQSGGPAPAVNAANGDIASQVASYFKARGVTPNPSSVDYWTQKWGEFGAKDPAYFNQRLAIADEFGGGGSSSSSIGATPRQPVTLGYRPTATAYNPTAPLTAALEAPQLRYRPLVSIGDY